MGVSHIISLYVIISSFEFTWMVHEKGNKFTGIQ